MMQSKICTKCKIEKSIDDYRNSKNHKGGKEHQCRACRQSMETARLRANPERRRKKKESNKNWYHKNKVYTREKYIEWKLKNKEHLEQYYKEYNSKRGDYGKLYSRGKRLMVYWPGLTWAECLIKYEELVKAQEYCCAICKKHQSHFKNSLAVDHSHKTGRVRAALCYRCNRLYVGIHTKDTAAKVLEYLNKYDKEEDDDAA